MDDILATFAQYSSYAYGVLFLYSFGGGMIALLGAGLLASTGVLDISLCIFIAVVANFLGDEALFYFARLNKAEVLAKIRKHRRKLALAQILFRSYGSKIILAKKYIYGLKTLIPLAIGVTKFSAKKFLLLNAISAVIWGISLGLLSYFAGDLVKKLSDYAGENSTALLGLLALVLVLIWMYFSKITKKEK